MFKITSRFAVMSMINCTGHLKVGPHCVQLPHAALGIAVQLPLPLLSLCTYAL
jgi:hypothetical protein